MIKAVIFDFAGVIGVDGYWAWLRDNIADIDGEREYFERISFEVDRAELTEEQFLEAIRAKCGFPVPRIRREILSRMKIDQKMVELIGRVKQHYKTGLLSNFIFAWLDTILRQNDLYRLFDQAVISSAHRMAKPDPQIFLKTAGLLEVAPAEAVFVDDRTYNVEAANKVGMTGLLFVSAEGLAADMAKLGLTVK